MKLWNFEKFFFRFNILVTMIVFVLLTPATQIIASWYPDDKNTLWRFPVFIIGISGIVWFVASLCLPYLFKWGFFEERRTGPRDPIRPSSVRLLRIGSPIFVFIVHLLILLFCCFCLVVFMQSHTLSQLFLNLP